MQTQIQCPNCGAPIVADIHQVIDADTQPQLKQRLLSGQLNVAQCQSCGWAGMLGTPMVYHDSTHDLLMVYVPMELNLNVPDREQMVGRMVRQVVDNLPPEKRRAYVLTPQQVLQWKTFIEKVLETEGITPEMIERQQKQMQLLQNLARADAEVAEILLTDNKHLVDEAFLELMQQIIDSLLQNPQATQEATNLTNLRFQLMTTTEAGRRLEARNMALHQFKQSAQKAGGLSPKLLVEFIIQHRSRPDVIDALIAAGQGALGYEFFQHLSDEIDRAKDPVDKKLLGDIRARLLELYDAMRAASDEIMNRASGLLETLLDAADQRAAIAENMEAIDEPFMYLVQMRLQQAEREKDRLQAARLRALQEQIVAVARDSVPADVRLLNALMEAENEEEQRRLLDEHADIVTPHFAEALRQLSTELAAQGQLDLKTKLDDIQSMVTVRV